MRSSWKRTGLLAGAVVAVLMAGVAIADIPDGNGVIHGCQGAKGTLRVVDTEAGESCKGNETALNWDYGVNLVPSFGSTGPLSAGTFATVAGPSTVTVPVGTHANLIEIHAQATVHCACPDGGLVTHELLQNGASVATAFDTVNPASSPSASSVSTLSLSQFENRVPGTYAYTYRVKFDPRFTGGATPSTVTGELNVVDLGPTRPAS